MLKSENPFMWTPECQKAFEELKEKLCSEPILTRYRPELMCILDCDSQGQTLGAVLSQKHPGEKVERVLAYSSWTLKRAELQYSPTEGELMAVLYGLKAFRQYRLGRRVPVLGEKGPLGVKVAPQASQPFVRALGSLSLRNRLTLHL
jgi:hypothetical protein